MHECFVCGTPCEPAIDLPSLPLTDTYGVFGQKRVQAPASGIDQQLLSCPECGHGQLATIVPPDGLYTAEYSFRTAASQTASAGTDFFLDFLDQVAAGRQFQCALDVGCNDLHLLRRLKDRTRHGVGIDPIWAGREDQCPDSHIIVCGALAEQANLATLLPVPADLIVARHTMEHIHRPVDTIRLLLAHSSPDVLIIIEVPGFDTLVRRRRYDQVFHQHVQYYSRSSLTQLVHECGGEVAATAENYHNWGAMLVAMRRAAGRPAPAPRPAPSVRAIIDGFRRFRDDIADVEPFVISLGGPIYGYGAAQMLPVLGYHMRTDFSFLEAIIDDDPSKDGMGYWNLPVRIAQRSPAIDLSDATVLITAADNAAPILRRLLQDRPKHIVTPFRLI